MQQIYPFKEPEFVLWLSVPIWISDPLFCTTTLFALGIVSKLNTSQLLSTYAFQVLKIQFFNLRKVTLLLQSGIWFFLLTHSLSCIEDPLICPVLLNQLPVHVPFLVALLRVLIQSYCQAQPNRLTKAANWAGWYYYHNPPPGTGRPDKYFLAKIELCRQIQSCFSQWVNFKNIFKP